VYITGAQICAGMQDFAETLICGCTDVDSGIDVGLVLGCQIGLGFVNKCSPDSNTNQN